MHGSTRNNLKVPDPKRLYLNVPRLISCFGSEKSVLTALAMVLLAVVAISVIFRYF